MTEPADRDRARARARVLSLVLDAVDPRVDGDLRARAFKEAGDLDVDMAYTFTRGMVFGLLTLVRWDDGEAAVWALMQMLAESSMVLLDEV